LADESGRPLLPHRAAQTQTTTRSEHCSKTV
jgi:hypothetical protein